MAGKNYEHPEFLIYSRLKGLKAENPDLKIKGLDALMKDVRQILDENCLAITQSAHFHVMMEDMDEMNLDVLVMLLDMYEAAIKRLRKSVQDRLEKRHSQPGRP